MKKLLITILSTISISACYAETPVVDKKVYAEQKMIMSLAKVAEKSNQCVEQEKNINTSPIKALNLTPDELRIALTYYSLKALTDCYAPELKDYMLASAVYSWISKTDYFEKSTAVAHDVVSLTKAEADFVTLSKGTRDKLDSIAEIKQPFKVLKAAEALGLM